jgi:hypothetical protein
VLYFLDERSFPEVALQLMDDLGLGAMNVHIDVVLALDRRALPMGGERGERCLFLKRKIKLRGSMKNT